MAVATVPAIETDRISDVTIATIVIWYQRPGKTGCFGLGKDASKPMDKVISVNIILKNFFAFDATANYVVQGSGCVYPCFSRHNNNL
jgi:hypothetical protein